MNNRRSIRVLIVDDSAIVRKMISTALSTDPVIEVIGAAADPYEARELIQGHKPDLLTLDIDMPRMNGLAFLKILKEHHPIPSIVITSLLSTHEALANEAKSLGAFEVIAKPTSSQTAGAFARKIQTAIHGAIESRYPAEAGGSCRVIDDSVPQNTQYHPKQLILIGASTGGPEALREILSTLPAGMPPILIAQHMPASFSRAFAERMNHVSKLSVREALDGDNLSAGMVLVAPGDYHLRVTWSGHSYRVSLDQSPPVHHCRPSVDVLFQSAALCKQARIVACILTGMGSDGALGMKALKEMGARTMVQDEHDCIVFGMPKAARELGAADSSIPLHRISHELVALASTMRS